MGLFDFLGGKNKSVKNTNVDPNAFQYGGRKGAADEEAGYYRDQAQATDARGAPLADYTQANQARGMQGYAAGKMQEAMLGNAPSVAQIQAQQGNEQAIANQLAAAASARGTGAAMAAQQRAAQQQGGAMAQSLIGQNAALRAQEIADARNAYAGLATGMRGQDLGASQFQAQQELASRSANDARALSEEQLRQGVMGAQMQAQQNYANLQSGVAGANAKADQQNKAGVIGAIGGIISDERQKMGFAPAGEDDSVPGARYSGVSSMTSQLARMGPDRDKPVTGQDIRDRIKGASEDAGPNMRITPVAASGAGVAGGNAGLFGAGGLFGKKSDDGSIPSTDMTKPQDGFQGFLRGISAFSSDQRGKFGFSSDIRGKMYSDERGKSPGGGTGVADSLLDTLKGSAATYKYKDPNNEPREAGPTGGKYLGVMAQDLERVPQIGPQLVSEGDNGMKSVEGGAALSAVMGGLGRITERLERLEKRGAARRG